MSAVYEKVVSDLRECATNNRNRPMVVAEHIINVYHSLDSMPLTEVETQSLRNLLTDAITVINNDKRLGEFSKGNLLTWLRDKELWEEARQ